MYNIIFDGIRQCFVLSANLSPRRASIMLRTSSAHRVSLVMVSYICITPYDNGIYGSIYLPSPAADLFSDGTTHIYGCTHIIPVQHQQYSRFSPVLILNDYCSMTLPWDVHINVNVLLLFIYMIYKHRIDRVFCCCCGWVTQSCMFNGIIYGLYSVCISCWYCGGSLPLSCRQISPCALVRSKWKPETASVQQTQAAVTSSIIHVYRYICSIHVLGELPELSSLVVRKCAAHPVVWYHYNVDVLLFTEERRRANLKNMLRFCRDSVFCRSEHPAVCAPPIIYIYDMIHPKGRLQQCIISHTYCI